MTSIEAMHAEATGEARVESVPLSHLSVELGHLYMEDFRPGARSLTAYFQQVAPWVKTATDALAMPRKGRPRVSTCFLIDDYFSRLYKPPAVLPAVLEAAAEAGLTIDYVARESACARANGLPLAHLVEDRLVADPPEDTNGSRPPVTESGWLCNGVRSPGAPSQAMAADSGWEPPLENGARNHSVFLDVELWKGNGEDRLWSCAFLAGVWQLLRLGALRFEGKSVTIPEPAPDEWPTDWDDLPPVVCLRQGANPFSAYRTLSILTDRFLPTEHAVRTILGQVEVAPEVVAQIAKRSTDEGFALPAKIIDRINYVFVGGLTDPG